MIVPRRVFSPRSWEAGWFGGVVPSLHHAFGSNPLWPPWSDVSPRLEHWHGFCWGDWWSTQMTKHQPNKLKFHCKYPIWIGILNKLNPFSVGPYFSPFIGTFYKHFRCPWRCSGATSGSARWCPIGYCLIRVAFVELRKMPHFLQVFLLAPIDGAVDVEFLGSSNILNITFLFVPSPNIIPTKLTKSGISPIKPNTSQAIPKCCPIKPKCWAISWAPIQSLDRWESHKESDI